MTFRRTLLSACWPRWPCWLPRPLPRAEQGRIKLGWATPTAPRDPSAVGAHAFKNALEAASKGSHRGPAVSQRQLGDEKPMVEGMRFGTVDAAIITNAVVAQLEPSFQLNDLPFLYASEAQAPSPGRQSGRRNRPSA